jgi:quercetin dioxygenase-like cupin family protein
MAERVVHDPVLRQRYSFTVTADEDGGEVLHVDTWVDPGGGVTPHLHPAMEERFHVLSGRPSFLAGGKWSTAAPGDVVVVPAGLRHSYRNEGDEPAHIRCDVRPPSSLQAFLEEVAALSQAGRITRRGLPTSPGAALQLALLVQRHREMVTLGAPAPPPLLQRLVIPPLAWLAVRRGY